MHWRNHECQTINPCICNSLYRHHFLINHYCCCCCIVVNCQTGKHNIRRQFVVPSCNIDSAEVGSAEVGSAEVGSAEVDSAEVGSAEVGSAEVGSAEVGSAEVYSTWNTRLNHFLIVIPLILVIARNCKSLCMLL